VVAPGFVDPGRVWFCMNWFLKWVCHCGSDNLTILWFLIQIVRVQCSQSDTTMNTASGWHSFYYTAWVNSAFYLLWSVTSEAYGPVHLLIHAVTEDFHSTIFRRHHILGEISFCNCFPPCLIRGVQNLLNKWSASWSSFLAVTTGTMLVNEVCWELVVINTPVPLPVCILFTANDLCCATRYVSHLL